MENCPRDLVGVYPMGGGGLLEIPYRHYFEVKHLRNKVLFDKNMNVLELGCGNGRWILSLAPLVKHYTGVDFSNLALEIAEEEIMKNGLKNVSLLEKNIIDFQADRNYDIVYFSGVTQYLQDYEISRILINLEPYLKNDAVLIDRSTINYKTRETLSTPEYFSIFRTPKEINEIYSVIDYHLVYNKRSYRFLRCNRLMQSKYFRLIVSFFMKFTKPITYYGMYLVSFLADTLCPKPFEGGNRSHDFLIFKKSNNYG